MQRRDLIRHVSAQCNLSMADARRVVDCMADAIAGQLLAGRVVTIRKFGMFSPRKDDKVHFKPYFRQNNIPV
ncbi:HU family DNA-binding protein [Solidesulfovibrio sp.]